MHPASSDDRCAPLEGATTSASTRRTRLRSPPDRPRRTRGGKEREASWPSPPPPLDQPFTQATPPSQPALELQHAPVVALVVVAKQMQQAVKRQHAQLRQGGMAGGASLAPGHAARDHNVSKIRPHRE